MTDERGVISGNKPTSLSQHGFRYSDDPIDGSKNSGVQAILSRCRFDKSMNGFHAGHSHGSLGE